MIVSELKQILDILENNGSANKYIETGHGVIFIPIEDEDTINSNDLIDLKKLGVFYSEEYGSYICYT